MRIVGMVHTPDFRPRGLGSSACWSQHVVFLSKTFYACFASLHSRVEFMGSGKIWSKPDKMG